MEIIWQKKRNNKRLVLRIKNGKVYVSSPYYTRKKDIDQFIEKSMPWIQRQLEKDEDCILKEGNTIFLFGKEFELVYDNQFLILNDILYFTDNEIKWKTFLKNYGNEKLEQRFYSWCQVMGYKDIELSFGFFKSKFGSCQKNKKSIKLSSYLAFCTWIQIDAIIVHELCHLKHSNHSKDFYHEVLRWYPNYYETFHQLKDFKIYRAL